MSSMLARVFKIVGLSIILMAAVDATTILIDGVVVNNRINSLGNKMALEMSKYNCLPDNMVELYQGEMDDIKAKSLYTKKITWNKDSSVLAKGENHSPVGEEYVRDTGEELTLAIRVDYTWRSLLFSKGADSETGSFLSSVSSERTRDYTFNASALRYLK